MDVNNINKVQMRPTLKTEFLPSDNMSRSEMLEREAGMCECLCWEEVVKSR